ncbi:MAG: nucleoside hydrolase [Actinomycetota bacterium]
MRVAIVLIASALVGAACGTGDAADLSAGGGRSLAGAEAATALVVVDDGDQVQTAMSSAAGSVDVVEVPVDPVPLAAETVIADETPARLAVNPEVGAPNGVPLVIFDTDLGPDVDDALALAMLHGYQKRGLIEIAAVTLTRNSVVGARYADALNTFYGRPDIPIGIQPDAPAAFSDTTNFPALADRWPHDLTADGVVEGYRLQRQVLARAVDEGRSVIIIQVGFSGNLAKLVTSGGDDISPLTGDELIRRSVSVLSVMGGAIERSLVEFNIKHDIGAAQTLFERWPGRIILSPFEIGYGIHYPYASIRNDFGWVDRHPIRESYEFRDLDWHHNSGAYYDMRSWDLTAVMEAVEPNSGYFLISQPGRVTVDGSGRTTFATGGGQHYVLDRSREYVGDRRQRIVSRMIELVADRP